MDALVFSRSPSFERHLGTALDGARYRIFRSPPGPANLSVQNTSIALVHVRSFPDELPDLLSPLTRRGGPAVGIAADRPQLEEMLRLSEHGIRAYFNSYMADTHYQQMLRLLQDGQTWFAPDLLTRALGLARRTVATTSSGHVMKVLTSRERQIALDVAQGLSNKRIASTRSISERTVKTHLTRIFKKLRIPDRVALAIRLSGHAQ